MVQPDCVAIDPIRLAWLLRADVRAGRPLTAIPEDFRLWWATNGRREYPAFARASSVSEMELFAPMPDWPSFGRFGMTRFLRYMLDTREDLQRVFDVSTGHGLWEAIAWQFVHGIREYALSGQLDAATLAALSETPALLSTPVDDVEAGRTEITWLMFFVWRCDAGLQRLFDLRSGRGRQGYALWFWTEAIPNLRLMPLIPERQRDWLRQGQEDRVLPGKTVPRIAVLLWLHRPDLQAAFDIRTPVGWSGLSEWARSGWQNEPAMQWLAVGDDVPSGSAGIEVPKSRPFGLNLIGFAFGELGIGEDVRMAAAACEAAGIPFKVVNIDPGANLRQADRALAGHVERYGTEASYAINLFCLTAFDTVRVFLERGLPLFEGRYNIGWWPWELPVWPRDWRIAFDLVDEVWAATEFTRAMYTAGRVSQASGASSPRVTLMPMAVSVARAVPVTRQKLGLPEKRFLFLYVFDFNSYLVRKNPSAAVKAFRRAFPASDTSVGLVLKTMNSNPRNPAWLRFLRECAKDPRIVVLERTLDRGEVLGLIDACDAYVSLHRSEGFGRTLAEAMLFGKPVVGTGFSGNADFLTSEIGFPVKWKRRPVAPGDYPFITVADRAWWAEPDIADATRQMQAARQAAQDPKFARRVKAFAQERFSPQCVGASMKQRTEEVASCTVTQAARQP